jgi:hypothetical protein
MSRGGASDGWWRLVVIVVGGVVAKTKEGMGAAEAKTRGEGKRKQGGDASDRATHGRAAG